MRVNDCIEGQRDEVCFTGTLWSCTKILLMTDAIDSFFRLLKGALVPVIVVVELGFFYY